MEASAAGLATGGDTAQAAPATEAAPQGNDAIAALQQQLQDQSTQQQEMWQWMQDNPTLQPPAEAPAEQPPPDLSFLDEASPNYNPEQAAQALQNLISQEADARVQAALTPVQQEMAEFRSQQGADQLTAEFPELAQPDKAEALVKFATQMAEQIGNPELISNWGFMRVAHMASRASQQAQQQGAGDGATAATLEGAGGASPAGTQGATTADEITKNWGAASQLFGPPR